MKSADKRSGEERRKMIDPTYLGVKSRRRRRRGSEPRREEDQADRAKPVGLLGF